MNAHFRSINAILILILVVFATGCDAFSSKSDDESGFVTLSGQVLNEATNNPVSSAFVRVLPYDLLFEVGQDGSYAFDVEIDSTMELDVSASAEGYRPVSLPVLAIAGRTISVPTFRLTQVVEQQATSGSASNIILESQTLATIGVRESGSAELAGLTFQLADSLGNPIVLSQAATVNFRFGVQPGGGEFLSPSSVLTDNNGIATVNLCSGTKAGVVQVIAESTVNGRVIRSQPVAVTIHGGMPDQAHFSLGPAKRNFPGLNLFGTTNEISVIVGDKYSNPVRVGSSVYFDTSHGIIEGSTITDSQGQGSVTLISANPLPTDGIAHIRAFTADYQHVVRGSGITEFTFRVIDNVDPLNPEVPVLEVITISVSGPNGSLEVVLGGSGAPYSRTDGVEMVRTTDGLYRFELAGNPIQQR